VQDMKNIKKSTRKREMFRPLNKILINILKAIEMIANIMLQKIMVNLQEQIDTQLATNLPIAVQISIEEVKDNPYLKEQRLRLARNLTPIIMMIIIKSNLVLNIKNLRLKHMGREVLLQSPMMTTIMESNIIKKIILKEKMISTMKIITTMLSMVMKPKQSKKVPSIGKGLVRMQELVKRYLIKQNSSPLKWS